MPKQRQLKDLKVAIVHDWLIGGGAERVIYELHQMFPEAPIYTSYCTKQWRAKLDGKVVTSWLQWWPFSKLRKFIPILRILWFTNLKLKGYDLVISSSGAEAKGIKVPEGTLHINYCHAPTHYYWSRFNEYMKHPGMGVFDPLARLGLLTFVLPLRKWDYKAAQRPHVMVGNSTHITAEIKKYYGRDAEVVFPPIDLSRFKSDTPAADRYGLITIGRQTPYKRFDIAIEACNQLNLPLTVLGDGPDHNRLTGLAGPTISFRTNVSDEEVNRYMAKAQGFIFPGLDDFGITPLEAMASGTPVIAYKAGGSLDYVVPGITGEFFEPHTPEALAETLAAFEPEHYSPKKIVAKATTFSPQVFRQKMEEVILKSLPNEP